MTQHVLPYDPTVFDVVSMSEAMSIILTDEDGGYDTKRRWDAETPWLANLIWQQLGIDSSSVVLDYGCGVGRLARELIQRTGCRVIGADISQNMRTLATRYVDSPRFAAVHPDMLDRIDIRATAALSVWVLQHCPDVELDLARIGSALRDGGGLFVLNEERRCVPTPVGWVNDNKDVRALLNWSFVKQTEGRLADGVASDECRDRTFWATYCK